VNLVRENNNAIDRRPLLLAFSVVDANAAIH